MALDPLSGLLRSLDLAAGEVEDGFVGDPGDRGDALFGGLVAAMAVSALARTVVPERRLHSLHAYFLRFGRHGAPIAFQVERVRDGGSFSTRQLTATQLGAAIFIATASFCRPEPGISHQDDPPAAPPPEGLPDRDQVRKQIVGRRSRNNAVEVRMCDPHPFGATAPREPRQRLWIRPRGPLPDDPTVHEAVLAYISDTAFMSTLNLRHPMKWSERSAASLDHALWIHRPPRVDEWVLYASRSPASHAARGLVEGAIYDGSGQRIASVAQEALVRNRNDRERTRPADTGP